MNLETSFLSYFVPLQDPRQAGKVKYPLNEILLLSLLACLSGATTFSDIALYGKSKVDFLKSLLPFTQGIPSHDTLGAVFSALNPSVFATCFTQWVASLRKEITEVIAIDGKTLRHSFDAEHPAIHMVSAWASQQRLVLGQVKVSEKSNEITAIPELLKMLDVNGATVTIDAMGCQHAIARQITEGGGDYLLALKGNQGGLFEDVTSYVKQQKKEGFRQIDCQHWEQTEKGHGRLEKRVYGLCSSVDWLQERHPHWVNLNAIVWVDSLRRVDSKTSRETRYYVTSHVSDVEKVAECVRLHWGIENSLHWVLDMNFGDDQCRVSQGNSAENLHRVKQMALTLLQQGKGKKSVRGCQKQAGWDNATLLKLLTNPS